MTRIAIAGASGFVGQALTSRLSAKHSVRALGRRLPSQSAPNVEWKSVDLFSAQSAREALQGIDVAIYLVHSMMPSSRLFQGNFHDTDLLLADNFAYACKQNGVSRILYLGGLIPEGYISPHLQSRKEVEEVLRSYGIPVTSLRAGMIVGPGGSSFEILRSLVQKLPVMILPLWTQSKTQAVFIDDVVAVIEAAVEQESFSGRSIDVVNGEELDYKKILELTARAMGLRRWMMPVSIASTGFSKLWVQLFGNSSYELVSPLIDSLLCDLPQIKPSAEIAPLIGYHHFEQMVTETLRRVPRGSPRPRRRLARADSVRSIQRLPSVAQDSHWIAREYLKWLPTFFRTVITVKTDSAVGKVSFHIAGIAIPMLVFESIKDCFESSRAKFHIVGGVLTKTTNTGWLEFRQIENKKYTLASIHEFVPRLPWLAYILTQAPLHAFVMREFGKHLRNRPLEGPLTPAAR
jgi:uncharacterized protein YbjT (DUF2867 family)